MEWNDERIALLTRLWREGFSASQVARQLGEISRSAVIGKIHRLGIAGRDLPAQPRNLGGRSPNSARRASLQAPRQGVDRTRRRPSAPLCVAFEAQPTATLITLTEHGCRWPIGDPEETGFGFCGRLRDGRGSYCAGHAPMASGRRVAAIPPKQIEHLVDRYGDTPTTNFHQAAYS